MYAVEVLQMTRSTKWLSSLALVLGFSAVSTAVAQDAPVSPAPVATAPATQPLAADTGLVYEVFEVAGSVLVAPIGLDPLKDHASWRQVKQGESLVQGQQIRTTLRSKLKLVARPADPPTVILVEPGTRMTIETLAMESGVAKSRMSIGYGAMRAGVAEGTARSDMEIATPQAVLSKKGTDIFRVEYMNGRFNMSLSEKGRGMLQAIQLQLSNRGDVVGMKSRLVTPGQQVTHRMAQAIESMTFDRDINMTDVFGLVGNDRLFTLLNDRGFGILLPFNNVTGSLRGDQSRPAGSTASDLATTLFNQPTPTVRSITDGDFGIGQSPLPSIFGNTFRNRQPDRRAVGFKKGMNEAFRSFWKQQTRPRLNIGRARR